jgi:hypothetical protein
VLLLTFAISKGKLGSRGVSRNPFQSSKTGVVTLLNKLIQIVEWPQPLPEGKSLVCILIVLVNSHFISFLF